MDHTLTLEPRSITGKQVKHLRTAGKVPASICGRGITPTNYVADAKTFGRVYQQVGKTGLVELQTPTGTMQAFIREIQRHPVTNVWLHVDFHIVDMRVAMNADVPLVLVGENELVNRGQAISNLVLSTLHVRALPADLPQNIEVDISGITDFNTMLHVRDLKLDSAVEVLTPEDEAVATLNPSRTASDEEEIVEEEQAGEPELSGDEEAETEAGEASDEE